MPPSPRLKATVDAAKCDLACRELNITVPTIVVKSGNHPEGTRYGDYDPNDHSIRLYLGGITNYEKDGLRFAQTELVRTLLHELRHGWQFIHSRELYDNVVPAEHDAEGWALRKIAEYRNIVRLSRSFPNSGFSRLTRHART